MEIARLRRRVTDRGALDYLRFDGEEIIAAAGLREGLSFTSYRQSGFTKGADSDLSDAELRAAGRHRSAHSYRHMRSARVNS